MDEPKSRKPRFPLVAIFALMLGIAVGSSLETFQLWVARAVAALTNRPMPPSVATDYVVEPPDVLLIDYLGSKSQVAAIEGEHLVGPDGRLNFGDLGSVYVTGLTLPQVQHAVATSLGEADPSRFVVSVLAANSKRFYVIKKGDRNDMVIQSPFTGVETVRDGVAAAGGIRPGTEAKVWVARPAPSGGGEQILPVNWEAIAEDGAAAANQALKNGDRLFIETADRAEATPSDLPNSQADAAPKSMPTRL